MNGTPSGKPDIILIGAGIMSATLAVFLKELDPSLSIEIFEMLDGAALESSDAWNNAGTGHAALCELNYTPERADGRDARTLSEWVPIVMGGRVVNQDVAATRMIIGADVNYGALTRNLIAYLQTLSGFAIHYSHHITHLHRDADGWRVEARDLTSGRSVSTRAKFVFLGAGGGALPLLQKSGILEAYGYAGFPVSGRLAADVGAASRHAHHRQPASHLVWALCRVLDQIPQARLAARSVHMSIRPGNIVPLMEVGLHNFDLTEYLVEQVVQSPKDRFGILRALADRRRRSDAQGARRHRGVLGLQNV